MSFNRLGTHTHVFSQGFWYADLTVGPQNFSVRPRSLLVAVQTLTYRPMTAQLAVDTGSFAVIIEQGKYLPSPSSEQTGKGEFIQFNGATEDGIELASVSNLLHRLD